MDFARLAQRFAHVADPTKQVLAANPSLIDDLAAEAPGGLFKLIAGLGRYLKKRDFTIPATVAAASRDYLFSQDIVGQWLADCCDTTNPNERSTLKEHQPGLADRLALVSLIALSLAVLLVVVLRIGNRHI